MGMNDYDTIAFPPKAKNYLRAGWIGHERTKSGKGFLIILLNEAQEIHAEIRMSLDEGRALARKITAQLSDV